MRASPSLVLGFASFGLALALFAHERPADACSCVGADARILAPDRVDDAPVNTRVRLEVPSAVMRVQGAPAPRAALRAIGSNDDVAVTASVMPSGDVDVVELVPSAPLSPSTAYEVDVIDTSRRPSTYVVGTFKTGAAADHVAPKIEGAVRVVPYKNVHAGGGDCSVHGPWIEITEMRGADPSRANAQILYAVWRADASGRIDASKPPATLVQSWRERITIGKRSLCDSRMFDLPKSGRVVLGIAAVDEAGNASPVRTIVVDIDKAVTERRYR